MHSPKVMMTLFWTTSGLQVSNFVEGEPFHAEYFVRDMLNPIHSLPIVGVAHKQRKWCILHMDNSPIRNATVTEFGAVPGVTIEHTPNGWTNDEMKKKSVG
jgi:hypothetical protein